MLLMQRMQRGPKPRPQKVKVAELQQDAPEIMDVPYWVGPSPRVSLPASTLVMQGAHPYQASHPFVRALNEGYERLAEFYRTRAPRNVREMYEVDVWGEPGEELPPWELPWLSRERRSPPGEKGLSADHGVSYYGPCSDEKVRLELQRLRSVVNAIKVDGFKPDTYGDIEGHFMRSGSEMRFFVRGGKHRAAALVFLGWRFIPVRMKEHWPRMIDRADSMSWPLVRAGIMSEKLALSIFDRYFK